MYNYARTIGYNSTQNNDAELKPRMSWSIVLVYNKYINHRIMCVYTGNGMRLYVKIRGLQTFFLL